MVRTATSPPGLVLSSARGRQIVAATVLGSGMAALDATVVNIALPSIGREFQVGASAVQWVSSAYTLTLAAFLLVGGSLGDRVGRRRVYAFGIVWFALASAACALAPDALALTLTRALQGMGAALLTPGSLSILEASFTPADRPGAIGAWSGLGGVATAGGPLLGGYLVSAASWRLIFLINLPVAATLLVLLRTVPETRDPGAGGHIDVAGALAAAVFLAGLTFTCIEAPSAGWSSPAVAGMAAAGAIGLAAFALREKTAAVPMLPLSLFGNRQLAATNAVTLAVYAGMGAVTFLLPVELQVVWGYSPLASGLALLPVTAIMLALSARSGQVAARIGPRLQMSLGPLIVAGGFALLVRASSNDGYVSQVLPALVVFGLGLATTVAPLTATAMGSAPAERSGIASAVNNDVARLGGLLAVAVLPGVAGITGDAYLRSAQLAVGFRMAVLIAAGLCAAGGVLAAATIRNRLPEPPPSSDLFHCGLEAPPLTTKGDGGCGGT